MKNSDSLYEKSPAKQDSCKGQNISLQPGHQLKENRFQAYTSCKKNLTFNSEGIKLANDSPTLIQLDLRWHPLKVTRKI